MLTDAEIERLAEALTRKQSAVKEKTFDCQYLASLSIDEIKRRQHLKLMRSRGNRDL